MEGRGLGLSRLSPARYRDLSKVAEAAGFMWVRRVGSHNTFRNESGRIVVIPDHGSRDIVRPLVRKIIRDMGLSLEEYHRLLNEV